MNYLHWKRIKIKCYNRVSGFHSWEFTEHPSTDCFGGFLFVVVHPSPSSYDQLFQVEVVVVMNE